MDILNNAIYTVARCKYREGDDLHKKIHASDDADTTFCGKTITDMWYIISDTYTGTHNCKECAKIMKEQV